MGSEVSIKAVDANIYKLRLANEKLTQLTKTVEEAYRNFNFLVNSLTNEDELSRINEIGTKASLAKCLEPENIIREYFPDQSRIIFEGPQEGIQRT